MARKDVRNSVGFSDFLSSAEKGHTTKDVDLKRLEYFESDGSKLEIIKQKAINYMIKAEKQMQHHHLSSLIFWQSAMNNYEILLDLKLNQHKGTNITNLAKYFYQAFKVFMCNNCEQFDDPKNQICMLSYIRCLNELGKHNAVLKFMKKNEYLNNNIEYWLYAAMAQRKLFRYAEARKTLEIAQIKDLTNVKVQNELKLVDRLIQKPTKLKIEEYRMTKIKHEENYYNKLHDEDLAAYRILSIDGGGIRSLIPAFWLCEIEKRTHKPISHLFHMISGVSTSGIIAAGLTAPANEARFTPLYRASDVFDIFFKRHDDIFKKKNIFSKFIFKEHYNDKSKCKLFQEYFNEMRLKDSLTDLVIPACNENNLITTYLFTRYDAIKHQSKNDTYTEALMATSATPNIFKPYYMESEGLFYDGGLHVNNPSRIACSEALRYRIPKKKLFVLSLGTGSSVTVDPSENVSSLYWGSRFNDIAIQAQVGNTDVNMYNALKNNYKRWQVWFEKPISFSSLKQDDMNKLVEYASQFVEENDDNINQLVEYLINF